MFRTISLLLFILLSNSTISYSYLYCKGGKNQRATPINIGDLKLVYPPTILKVLDISLENEKKSIWNKCVASSDYQTGMKNLEFAIAFSAIENLEILEEVKKLNNNIIYLIESKFLPFAPQKNIHDYMVRYFGKCSPNTPGCVGENIHHISQVIAEGNLRERLQMLWYPASKFLKEEIFHCDIHEGKFLPSPHCICEENSLFTISNWLTQRGHSSLSNGIKNSCDALWAKQSLFKKGKFVALRDHLREVNARERRWEYSNFEVQKLAIPLSEREKNFLYEKTPFTKESTFVTLNAGMSLFFRKSLDDKGKQIDPHGLYYGLANKMGFRTVVSVSGTTDHFLNLGCIVGNTPEEQGKLRLAAFANMILHNHHSAYEVLIASLDYEGLNIDLNSDYYQHLLPSNELFQNSFAKMVEKNYLKISKNPQMPTQILENCISKSKNLIPTTEMANSLDAMPLLKKIKGETSL